MLDIVNSEDKITPTVFFNICLLTVSLPISFVQVHAVGGLKINVHVSSTGQICVTSPAEDWGVINFLRAKDSPYPIQ